MSDREPLQSSKLEASGQPPELLEFIPAIAQMVIAIGAIPKEIVRRYQQINPHCQFVTLESGDLMAAGLAVGSIDCLLFDGTLAHFHHFSAVLSHQLDFLRDGGQVLTLIPNAQYWVNIVNLLRGKVEPLEVARSSFNPTSLTLDQIQHLFQAVELQIYEIQTRGQKDEQFQQFQHLLQPMVQALGIEPNRFATQTAAQRYVVRAIKSPQRPRRLLIQTLMMAPTACDRVRVLEPDQLSRTLPGVRAVAAAKTWPNVTPVPGEEKVLIWQRTIMSYSDHLPRLKQLLQQDYLIIAEIDDNPLRRKEYADHHYLSYRGCHAVQTSTEPLATFLRQLNPYVGVFPNQLAFLPSPRTAENWDNTHQDNTHQDDPPKKVTLFFGALNREQDWQPIMEALNRVLVAHQNQVWVKVIHDRQFFDCLATSQKDFEPFCGYDRYQEILHTCHIGLLPLAPTAVNLMKSDLKFVECAGHGVAVLASPTVYERSIIDGETGVIYCTVKQFESQLQELITNHTLRQQIATKAYYWVRDHRLLSQHFHHRRDWYYQLRDQLPQLNRSLRDRVPELFTD
ncbi:MAG: glycosyltransferase family protein [Microcoleaceae cyanobacterium]